jgi:hypothetical protein
MLTTDVLRVEIDGQLNILSELLDGMNRRTNRFDLAIIAQPDSAFDAKDQVILDQFIMNGGRVLWLVDPMLDQPRQPIHECDDNGCFK